MSDYLTGTPLTDRIEGGAGRDTLFGQGGNDRLRGGEGSDTYYSYAGFGDDSVEDVDAEGDDLDAIYIGYDIDRAAVELARSGQNAVLKVAGQPDRITGAINATGNSLASAGRGGGLGRGKRTVWRFMQRVGDRWVERSHGAAWPASGWKFRPPSPLAGEGGGEGISRDGLRLCN
jgi:hypothetical protein